MVSRGFPVTDKEILVGNISFSAEIDIPGHIQMIRYLTDLHNIPCVTAVIFFEGRLTGHYDTRYVQAVQYKLHYFGNAVANCALLGENTDHGVIGDQPPLLSLIQSRVIVIRL